MFKKTERNKAAGFTLAELLIVVTIVGVLLAVAVPNVLSYYRSMKLTELDDNARTIFVAAQNRLTSMKSAGMDLTKLSSVPVDQNAGVGVATGRYFAVMAPSDPDDPNMLDVLVPGGSIEAQLHSGHYVVEIDAKTGAVFAVWYWEKDSAFKYNDAYKTVLSDKNDRLKNGQMVGYYGGDTIERITFQQTPIPSVQVTNGEELVLKITVPGFSVASPPAMKATVTISSGTAACKIIENVTLALDASNNYVGTIALDTLDESKYTNNGATSFSTGAMGKPFKEWVYDPIALSYIITPGANFDIEVKVCVDDDKYLPQYVYCEDVNSLFESVEEIKDAGGNATGNYTAHIAYGRHLQNLDKSTSGVADTIIVAVQTRNIDFDATGGDAVYSWYDTYLTAGAQREFTPITNSNLTSYDGANRTISELLIDESGDNVGLFSNTDAELLHIRLVNASVTGVSYVGVLAGRYSGTVITDCGAYVDNASKPASVTGHAYDHYIVTGSSDFVGGLVGDISSAATVTGSFASVKVLGASGVGGLVGQVDANSDFTNCYSGGHTVDGEYKLDSGDQANVTGASGVGGLVGTVTVGNTLTLKETNYSTCSVQADNTSWATLGLLVGGSTGDVAKDPAGAKVYTTGKALDKDGNAVDTTNLRDEITYLDTDRGTNVVADFLTVPYDTTLTGKYPYATNLSAHYGDWPVETASAQSLCYYDLVNGSYGVWGYIVDSAGGTPNFVNTLTSGAPNSGICATDDGYCVPVERVGGTSTTPGSVTITGKSGAAVYSLVSTGASYTAGGKTYDLYKINGLDLFDSTTHADLTDTYYHKIEVGGQEYWFNPFFACEVLTAEPTDKNTPQAKTDTNSLTPSSAPSTSTPSPDPNYAGRIIIRTARQLANMARATAADYCAQKSFVQLLDINFDQYPSVSAATGASWTSAVLRDGGIYNGNEFVISKLSISGTQNVGLFGSTTGVLENIRLKNVTVTGTGTATNSNQFVGALAGQFTGNIITNCGVYADSANYGTCGVTGVGRRVGGLVGSVSSSRGEAVLTKCFAAVEVVSTGNQVGGLFGYVATSHDNATLVDCYSGGRTENGTYTGANVTGDQQVGGLIGGVSGAGSYTVTLSGVNYSTCSVRMTSSSHTDRIGLLVGYVNDSTVQKGTAATDIAYATGVAYGTSATPRSESYLTPYATNLADILAVTNGGTAATADKYDGALGDSYPYLSAGTEHYGDWPELQEAVFYWEQEGSSNDIAKKQTDGTYEHDGYHFYAKGLLNGQEVTLDTLCNESSHTKANDGYGIYKLTAPTGAATDATPRDGGALFDDLFRVSDTNVCTFATTASGFYSINTKDNSKRYEFDLSTGKTINLIDN